MMSVASNVWEKHDAISLVRQRTMAIWRPKLSRVAERVCSWPTMTPCEVDNCSVELVYDGEEDMNAVGCLSENFSCSVTSALSEGMAFGATTMASA